MTALTAGQVFTHKRDSNITFKIKPNPIHCPLKPVEPTKFTAESLSTQLRNVGLNCENTEPKNLEAPIKEIHAKLPDGKLQAFGIDKINQNGSLHSKLLMDNKESLGQGQWEPSPTAVGYMTKLATVGTPTNFDKLKAEYPNFTGFKSPKPLEKSGNYGTIDAIKTMFFDVAYEATSAIVTGIDKVTLSSTFANILAPVTDQNATDYDSDKPQPANRMIFLVLGVSPTNNSVAGIGVLFVNWRLTIKDYKEKKKTPEHSATVTVTCRSVLYDDIAELEAQVAWLATHNKPSNAHSLSTQLSSPYGLFLATQAHSSALLRDIPYKSKFKVFDVVPARIDNNVWDSCLPVGGGDSRLTAIFFYGADLKCLGTLSNTSSKASSSYTLSTTSGFTFGMSQKIGATVSLEASVGVVKGGASFSLELSMSEQWNSSQTESLTFNVPGGSSAFVYKGIVKTKFVYYDPINQEFTWGSDGTFQTNNVITSDKPLTGDPIYSHPNQ